ncbi:MAG: helix-turn-helix domain-containing protein, partial [Candidatus Micrarchaeaceae archaeon]
MEKLLTQIGLNSLQAKAYMQLLSSEKTGPPELAKELGITRSNAYKVVGKLESLGLAQRNDIDNKLAYKAADPTALASIAAEKRNQAIVAEYAANKAIQKLTPIYRDKVKSVIATGSGRRAIVGAYRHQAEVKQPIY